MAVRQKTTRKKSKASSVQPRKAASSAARWSLVSIDLGELFPVGLGKSRIQQDGLSAERGQRVDIGARPVDSLKSKPRAQGRRGPILSVREMPQPGQGFVLEPLQVEADGMPGVAVPGG